MCDYFSTMIMGNPVERTMRERSVWCFGKFVVLNVYWNVFFLVSVAGTATLCPVLTKDGSEELFGVAASLATS